MEGGHLCGPLTCNEEITFPVLYILTNILREERREIERKGSEQERKKKRKHRNLFIILTTVNLFKQILN